MNVLCLAPFARAAVALAVMLTLIHPPLAGAPASPTATVSGRVLNGATGLYLANAEVRIVGTERVAYTDSSGAFELAGLAPGPTQLMVTYPGLDPPYAS